MSDTKPREMSRGEKKVVGWILRLFDFVAIALAAITVIFVIYMMWQLIVLAITSFDVQAILQGIVLILIFFEILEIVAMYIAYHHVQMRSIVEIGVLAIVKEFLTTLDLGQVGWETLLALAALIFAMGWIYIQERKRIDENKKFLLSKGIKDESMLEEDI